ASNANKWGQGGASALPSYIGILPSSSGMREEYQHLKKMASNLAKCLTFGARTGVLHQLRGRATLRGEVSTARDLFSRYGGCLQESWLILRSPSRLLPHRSLRC